MSTSRTFISMVQYLFTNHDVCRSDFMTTFALNNSKDAVMLLTGIDMEAMPAANSVLPCSYTRDGVICGQFL